MILKYLVHTLLFCPTVFIIRVGVAIVSLAETAIGRLTIRPLFRIFCHFILYARPLPFLREKSQYVLPNKDISAILKNQKIIAIIPCACRAGRSLCHHPLHKAHDTNTCISLGFAAILQIGSGLGKRIHAKQAQMLLKQASESGLVHHVICSMKAIVEICSCCPETCAAIRAYKSNIPEAVRPSKYIAIVLSECNGCSGRPMEICKEICPYAKHPSRPDCLGCGLCARYCPKHAIDMIPRVQLSR